MYEERNMISKIAKFLLVLGIVILVVGAVYMALVHRAYAISGCFVVAALLLVLLCILPNKKRDNYLDEHPTRYKGV